MPNERHGAEKTNIRADGWEDLEQNRLVYTCCAETSSIRALKAAKLGSKGTGVIADGDPIEIRDRLATVTAPSPSSSSWPCVH
jgi:hypothetical protein